MSEPWGDIEARVIEIVRGQKNRLLRMGRQVIPTLTPEDVLQPNDYLELEHNPEFRYEEGILAGMQALHMALNALKKELEHSFLTVKKEDVS